MSVPVNVSHSEQDAGSTFGENKDMLVSSAEPFHVRALLAGPSCDHALTAPSNVDIRGCP